MNKKLAAVICLTLTGTLALVKFLPQNPILRNYAGTRASLNLKDSEAYSIRDGYQIGFPFEDNLRGATGCYTLKYRPGAYDTAKKYAGMFIGVDSYEEDEDSYVFSGREGTVTIDREINRIHFEAALTDDRGELLRSDEDAVKIAEDFIERRLLTLIYEEAQVHYDGYAYRVDFINRINNLKNYAFPNQVTMDNYGQVITMDYYAIQYDKIGECRIKSVNDAFNELPAVKEDESVLLASCQLVYIYDESIIQPAYYFQGSVSNGNTFECFVKAAVY